MEVRIKLTHPNAVMPKYAKPGDAGMDLTAVDVHYDSQADQMTYNLGLALEVPEGYVALLFPRSSVKNYALQLSNAVAVIDSGFRGTISVVFNIKNNEQDFFYDVGDRVCQMIIIPYPQINLKEVKELSKTERGESGYGSTGK